MTKASDSFEYLREPALRYGLSWRWWASAQRVERSEAAKVHLAAAHDAICRREDVMPLALWSARRRLERVSEKDAPQAGAIDEAEFERGLRGLLRLFGVLGNRHIKPFDSPPLWFKVASGSGRGVRKSEAISLRKLARAAKTLGIRPGHQALSEFVDHVTPGQFNRLARIADTLRTNFHDHPERWRAQREALGAAARDVEAMLAALMHTLDALEIF